MYSSHLIEQILAYMFYLESVSSKCGEQSMKIHLYGDSGSSIILKIIH